MFVRKTEETFSVGLARNCVGSLLALFVIVLLVPLLLLLRVLGRSDSPAFCTTAPLPASRANSEQRIVNSNRSYAGLF